MDAPDSVDTDPPTVAPKKTRRLSPYIIFHKERSKDYENCPGKERMRKMAAAWKALSPEQKAVYQAKSLQPESPVNSVNSTETAKLAATAIAPLGTVIAATTARTPQRAAEEEDDILDEDDDAQQEEDVIVDDDGDE